MSGNERRILSDAVKLGNDLNRENKRLKEEVTKLNNLAYAMCEHCFTVGMKQPGVLIAFLEPDLPCASLAWQKLNNSRRLVIGKKTEFTAV